MPTRKPFSAKNAAHSSSSERPVRLDRVLDLLPRPEVLLRQLDGAPEEVEAHQRWLAALPRDRDERALGVRLDQLADVLLEQVVRHAEPAAWVEHLLREEEAVLAVEVADGSGWLR